MEHWVTIKAPDIATDFKTARAAWSQLLPLVSRLTAAINLNSQKKKKNIFEVVSFLALDICGGNEALENLLKILKRPTLRKGHQGEVTGHPFFGFQITHWYWTPKNQRYKKATFIKIHVFRPKKKCQGILFYLAGLHGTSGSQPLDGQ